MILQAIRRDRFGQRTESECHPKKLLQAFAPATERKKLVAYLLRRHRDGIQSREVNFDRMNPIAGERKDKWITAWGRGGPQQHSSRGVAVDLEETSIVNPILLEESINLKYLCHHKLIKFAIVAMLDLSNSCRLGEPVSAHLQPSLGDNLDSIIFELQS